jgi:hypothetical protein
MLVGPPSIAHHFIGNPFLFISLVVLELHRPFILVDSISFVGGRIDHHALAVMVDLKINTGERKSNDLFFDRLKKEKEIGSMISFRSLLAMIGFPKGLQEGRFRYDSATLFGVVGARQA